MSASSNAAACTDAQQDSAAPCNLHAQIPANFEFRPVRSALATRLPMTATYHQEMRCQLLNNKIKESPAFPPPPAFVIKPQSQLARAEHNQLA